MKKIVLCVVVFSLCLVFVGSAFLDVSAITRGELDKMENTLKNYKIDLNAFTLDIDKQKRKIANLEQVLINKNNDEGTARNVDNDIGTEQTRKILKEARANVQTATKELKQANIDLQSLINRKLVVESNIRSLTKIIDTNKNLVYQNSIIRDHGLTKILGVDLSKVCQIMIKNNLTSACPTYEEMISLDGSDYRSGSFKVIDGMFQRDKPLVQNDQRLYDFEKEYKIILDPSGNLKGSIRMITIELNFGTYLTVGDYDKTNNTRTINHDLYVDNCKNATISAETWLKTLPAVIHFMRNGCIDQIYNPQTIIHDKPTEYNHLDSPAFKILEKAEALKAKYKENRIGKD